MRDENARLALENEELQAQVALEKRRRQHVEATLERVTAFWRVAEEDVTAKIKELDEIKKSKDGDQDGESGNRVSHKGNVKTNRDHIEQENTVDGFGGRRKFVGIRI
ncbi:uncharacterized protein FOBCDRAFT_239459 [Fusarium oxysporum Fo47]|uniref:uncharacterized protein n=1 Tax=Fusarium oxysporum Fo47 TaxID=660027 RepID=UPI00286983B4|nr:uncharacterized protein FOBCDRAFT_239459 [Fusarium oxysporum Fo47]QKD53720.2 hypothetical protein FOBCDRAFT_239459 [Fusarium oxysporum Fo47]